MMESVGKSPLPGFTLFESPAPEAGSQQAKRMARVWQELGRQSPSSITPEKLISLKPLVRKGIPAEHRPVAWHILSGADARQRAAPVGYYKELCQQVAPYDLQHTIADDLHPSTFPLRTTQPLYQSPYGLDALRRLLRAWALHNPSAGYFRGLNCIAGFLLSVMGTAREEEAFWTLVSLLEDRMFNYCQGRGAVGARVEGVLLGALLPRKLPKVAAHLSGLDAVAGGLAGGWFTTLFTTLLPPETTARVWDTLLLEGHKVVQRTALAVLRKFEGSVLAARNAGQLRLALESRAAHLSDAEGLLGVAFKGIGPMPSAMISGLRGVALAEVEQQVAARQQALALLTGCRIH